MNDIVYFLYMYSLAETGAIGFTDKSEITGMRELPGVLVDKDLIFRSATATWVSGFGGFNSPHQGRCISRLLVADFLEKYLRQSTQTV